MQISELMEKVVFLSVPFGLVVGAIFGYRFSKMFAIWLSKLARAPRLVQNCGFVGALLFLYPTFAISIFVGGMVGGLWCEEVSLAIGYGSAGVPVGMALGIAVSFGSGIFIGTVLGGTIGKLLSHFLPTSVLAWRSREGTFKHKDASVHGGEMLISDPHKWQQLEEDHVAATCAKMAILGDSKI